MRKQLIVKLVIPSMRPTIPMDPAFSRRSGRIESRGGYIPNTLHEGRMFAAKFGRAVSSDEERSSGMDQFVKDGEGNSEGETWSVEHHFGQPRRN